ncbi:MAG: hypothetical protein WAK93_14075 [Solirubrobacteraceae bacterium]
MSYAGELAHGPSAASARTTCLTVNQQHAIQLVLGHPVPRCSDSGAGKRSHTGPSTPRPEGKVTARYAVRLVGGQQITPAGQPRAAARVVITFHRHAEVCWRFVYTHALNRPTTAMISKGPVVRAPIFPLGAGFHRHGCEVHLGARMVVAIERHPHNYVVEIDNHRYLSGAAVGALP